MNDVVADPGVGSLSIQTIQRSLKDDAQDLLEVVLQYLKDVETQNNVLDTGSVTPLSITTDDVAIQHSSYNSNDMPGEFADSIGSYTVPSTTINGLSYTDIEDIGPYTGYTYVPSFTAPPAYTEIDEPGDYTGDTDVTLPADVVIGNIQEPSFVPVNLPVINELDLPAFTATAPNTSDISVPVGSFSFSETDYTSDLLTQTDSLIQQMEAGGVGVPAQIWNSIWERAAEQEQKTGEQSVKQATREWAGRGFPLPPGTLVAQVADIRQKINDKKSSLSRDIAVNYSQEEIKNLQFAVQQGIAFESLRGGWYEQMLQRSFEVAKYVFEADYRTMDAKISLANLELQAFNTEATVYKVLIEAEIAKLEESRLAIQAQELTVSSNNSQVQLYGARVAAAKLDVEMYNAQIDAVNAKVKSIEAGIQVYSEKTKAYTARVGAQSIKADIYKSQVESEGIKMNSYETSVKAYSAEVQAFSARAGAENTKLQSQTQVESLKLDKLDSDVKAFVADLSTRTDVYRTKLEAHKDLTTQTDMLMKDNQFFTSSKIDSDKNKISVAGEETKVAIANAGLAAKQAEITLELTKNINKSAAEIAAGLAGSIYSAINASSSESDSISHGYNQSQSDVDSTSFSESHQHIYDHGDA